MRADRSNTGRSRRIELLVQSYYFAFGMKTYRGGGVCVAPGVKRSNGRPATKRTVTIMIQVQCTQLYSNQYDNDVHVFVYWLCTPSTSAWAPPLLNRPRRLYRSSAPRHPPPWARCTCQVDELVVLKYAFRSSGSLAQLQEATRA